MLFFCEKVEDGVIVLDAQNYKDLDGLFEYLGVERLEGKKSEKIELIGIENGAQEERFYDIESTFWDGFKIVVVPTEESKTILVKAEAKKLRIAFPFPHNAKPEEIAKLSGVIEEDAEAELDEKVEEIVQALSLTQIKTSITEWVNDSTIDKAMKKYGEEIEKETLEEHMKNPHKWKRISKRNVLNMFLDIKEKKLIERVFGLPVLDQRIQAVVYCNEKDSTIVKANFKLLD